MCAAVEVASLLGAGLEYVTVSRFPIGWRGSMFRRFCVSLGIVLCLLANVALAQTVTASITGTVSDPSGSVAPNVKVIATNTGTNLTYPATSNEAGVYNLLFLPVGQYNVSAEAQGFKKTILGP